MAFDAESWATELECLESMGYEITRDVCATNPAAVAVVLGTPAGISVTLTLAPAAGYPESGTPLAATITRARGLGDSQLSALTRQLKATATQAAENACPAAFECVTVAETAVAAAAPECPVCLEEVNPERARCVTAMACSHAFHEDCVFGWARELLERYAASTASADKAAAGRQAVAAARSIGETAARSHAMVVARRIEAEAALAREEALLAAVAARDSTASSSAGPGKGGKKPFAAAGAGSSSSNSGGGGASNSGKGGAAAIAPSGKGGKGGGGKGGGKAGGDVAPAPVSSSSAPAALAPEDVPDDLDVPMQQAVVAKAKAVVAARSADETQSAARLTKAEEASAAALAAAVATYGEAAAAAPPSGGAGADSASSTSTAGGVLTPATARAAFSDMLGAASGVTGGGGGGGGPPVCPACRVPMTAEFPPLTAGTAASSRYTGSGLSERFLAWLAKAQRAEAAPAPSPAPTLTSYCVGALDTAASRPAATSSTMTSVFTPEVVAYLKSLRARFASVYAHQAEVGGLIAAPAGGK